MKKCVLSELLVIFTRYPAPGKVKTRLIPALGAEASAELQRRMTLHTLREAGRVSARFSSSLEVHFEGGSKDLMKRLFGSDLNYFSQYGKDLGEKMLASFYRAFSQGRERVIICGSDCPDITAELIDQAFEALKSKEVVIGPAWDGGYYLIGLSRMIPEVFVNIPWGSSQVLNKTMSILESMSCSFTLLDPLNDVDRIEDLFLCHYLQEIQKGGFN